MPLYEYRCHSCGETFEVLGRTSSRDDDVKCPECDSGDTSKAFSTFATGGQSRGSSTAAANCAPGGG